MRNKKQFNAQQFVDFIEICVSHTFKEHTAHGMLVCIQEAVSSYWHYLSSICVHEDERLLSPTQRRHYQICSEVYESFEPVIADAFTRVLESKPRTYECPICCGEEPHEPLGPNDAHPVDWDDNDE